MVVVIFRQTVLKYRGNKISTSWVSPNWVRHNQSSRQKEEREQKAMIIMVSTYNWTNNQYHCLIKELISKQLPDINDYDYIAILCLDHLIQENDRSCIIYRLNEKVFLISIISIIKYSFFLLKKLQKCADSWPFVRNMIKSKLLFFGTLVETDSRRKLTAKNKSWCSTEFVRGVTPSTVWSQLTPITGNSVIHHHVVPYNSVSCLKRRRHL